MSLPGTVSLIRTFMLLKASVVVPITSHLRGLETGLQWCCAIELNLECGDVHILPLLFYVSKEHPPG